MKSLAWLHKIAFAARTSSIGTGVSLRLSSKSNFAFGRTSVIGYGDAIAKEGVQYVLSAVKQIWNRVQK